MKYGLQMAATSSECFVFFNRKNEVVVINGFKKKTQRTPSTELQRALTLKLQYQHETN